MTILVICEKPQAAMRIAYALSDNTPAKRNLSGIPYWEINCQGKKVFVASAVGHLFNLQEKEKSNQWPVFEVEWKASPGFAKKYIDALTHLAKQASEFVVACDYDLEGELIGFNVLRFICKRQDAARMKFSTLTRPDLSKAYAEMKPHIDFGQAYAGETRHLLDWYYGVNLSRALMQSLRRAGSFKVLSIGRVQGPALSLVAKRELEIRKFKPEPYWLVSLIVSNSEQIEVRHAKKFFERKEAEAFKGLKNKEAEASTEKKEKNLLPLPPFDLTTLQLEAHKLFGLTPVQTLEIAQQLYLAGLISYPRTSSQKLPATIGYKKILEKLSKNYQNLTKHIKRKKPIEGKKTDPAHPCIFPTGEQPKKLSRIAKQIYELIVKRFIACFCSDALIEEKQIKVFVGKELFTVKGSKLLEKGWLQVYPVKFEERSLPDLEGKVKVKEVRIEENITQPPKRYTSASLVLELEKRGLGTKGTRALIVDTLYKRGYITERQIKATQLGLAVNSALEENCPLILDEKLTRKFEQALEKIQTESSKEKILKEKEKILSEAKKVLTEISVQFKAKEAEIGERLLKAHKEQSAEQKKANTLCLCPVCKKGSLIVFRSKRGKRFALCENQECKASFGLPKDGLLKLAEKNCECGFPLLILIKKGKPPWTFCFNPQCSK